jgi:hypothetical protein
MTSRTGMRGPRHWPRPLGATPGAIRMNGFPILRISTDSGGGCSRGDELIWTLCCHSTLARASRSRHSAAHCPVRQCATLPFAACPPGQPTLALTGHRPPRIRALDRNSEETWTARRTVTRVHLSTRRPERVPGLGLRQWPGRPGLSAGPLCPSGEPRKRPRSGRRRSGRD